MCVAGPTSVSPIAQKQLPPLFLAQTSGGLEDPNFKMYYEGDICPWGVEQFRKKINLLSITDWNFLPSGGCSKSRRNVVWSKRDVTHKCSLRVEAKLGVFVPCMGTARS